MNVTRTLPLFALLLFVPFSPTTSQEASVAAQFGLHVVKAGAAAKFPHVAAMKNMHTIVLSREEAGKTFDVPLGTYVLIRSADPTAVQEYAVSPLHGILESPTGLLHMPMNVLGVLRAVKEGTATITVRGVPRGNRSQAPISGGSSSSNWSGYAITGGPFSFIQGQWHVPTVQQMGGTQYSATWIGIDGANSNTVLQVGTDQNNSCCLFPPQYSAWFELFPANPVAIPESVSPGDLMMAMLLPQAGASATVTPGLPATWTISLNDVTQGWVFTTNVSYTGMLSSAEWIEEAPLSCSNGNTVCTPLPLANYGSVAFDIQDFVCPPSGRSACPSNAMGTPNFNRNESISMIQSSLNQTIFSNPSNPDGDADGFSVAYAYFSGLTPTAPGPIFLDSGLPNAVVGQPYDRLVSFTQVCSPQWSIVGGNLPPGLNLGGPTSSCSTGFGSGPVTGTPTTPGAFAFTLNLTDSSDPGASTQQTVTLNVMQSPPPPDFGLTASPNIIKQRHGAAGCTGTTVIAVTPQNGFNASVSLSAPTNGTLGITFSPPSTQGTSTLTIPPGPCDQWPASTLVTGTSGSLSHTLKVGLNAPRCGGRGEPPCP